MSKIIYCCSKCGNKTIIKPDKIKVFSAYRCEKDKNGNDYLSCSVEIPFFGNISFTINGKEKKGKKPCKEYHLVWNEIEWKN